ncbi:MAG: hypothetical protein RLZZ74_935 [Cyanobacteriota bacterium]
MTTIVKHRRTGNEYILLGINGEANKANPSRFISELFNQEKSEVSCSATVCDVQGNIFLAYIDDLLVVEIDGLRPAEILPEANYEASYKTVDEDSRSPKGFAPEGASVEVVQSPPSEFEEEDFEDEEEDENEAEDEFDQEANPKPTPLQTPIVGNAVESLDAPNQDQVSDDEDWI